MPCELYGAKCAIHIAKRSSGSHFLILLIKNKNHDCIPRLSFKINQRLARAPKIGLLRRIMETRLLVCVWLTSRSEIIEFAIRESTECFTVYFDSFDVFLCYWCFESHYNLKLNKFGRIKYNTGSRCLAKHIFFCWKSC